jgi:hypothetical protein
LAGAALSAISARLLQCRQGRRVLDVLQRALLASVACILVYAACGAPENGGLFQPFDRDPVAAAGAGGSISAPSREPSSPPIGGDASVSEGQGGALGFSGAPGMGTAGGNNGSSVVDAGSSDAGDAGPSRDAAPEDRCSDSLERCDGLDNNCDGRVDEGGACAGACAGFALAGHGYMFCSDSVVRDVAADRCEAQGMRLAWIETPEENDFLVERIEVADVPASASEEVLTYIGASDSGDEGNWIWRGRGAIPNGFQFWQGESADSGGRAVGGAYANWAPTEPNNTDDDENCAAISVLGENNRQPGNWDDRDCDAALPFVCEAP